MRTFRRWVALASLMCGAAAQADINDFKISELGNPNRCANGTTTCATQDSIGYDALADVKFRAFSRVFGAAISSTNLAPPSTLGHSGFAINAELSYLTLPTEVELPVEGANQPQQLLLPSVHLRKGLPFSTELGVRVGWVDRSRMFATTAEVKVAINEGFAWLPDVGVRAHATRLFGQREFGLTAAGLDFGIGKPFAIGGMITLTPYGGWDLVGISAYTDQLDFNPGRPYSSTTANPEAALANTGVYKEVNLLENVNSRIYGGVRFIGGVFQIGAEVSVTSLGRIPTTGNQELVLPSVIALNTTLGLDF